ncbi:MAG TPA: hotdog fold thioesterase [Methanospirillum sp.]|nr:hotdog fold thioesterase [Methanospirillum sp.]
MDKATDFFSADTFSRDLGIELTASSIGQATMTLNITNRHLNSHGTVHGGVVFSLADVAFAVASNSHGIPSVAINTSITYMKAAREGTLIAEAREFSVNSKIGSYVVEVTNQDGDKIAVFQGLAYRKPSR